MIELLSKKLACFAKTHSNDVDEEKAEVISYGMELLLQELFTYTFILLLSIILKIQIYVIVTIIGYTLIRVFANGAHADTRNKCFYSYLLFIFSTVYLTKFVFNKYNLILSITVFLINVFILFKYAPGDTAENPIKNKFRIKLAKSISILSLIIITITSFLFKTYDPIISNVLIISSTFACLMTTPLFYKIYNCSRSC